MGAEKKEQVAAMPDIQEQLKQAEALIEKSVAYVAATQPLLDKHADYAERFQKRATEVVGVLIDRGIILPAESDAILHKLAEDNIRALDLVARMARLIGPDTLAKKADVNLTPGRKLDAFEALVINGDASKTQVESPLNVD